MKERFPLTVGAAVPQCGDVIVTHEAVNDLFTVSQFPGTAQFSASSRRDALDLAGAFAVKHAIDLWYYGGGDYEPIARHRPDLTAEGTHPAEMSPSNATTATGDRVR